MESKAVPEFLMKKTLSKTRLEFWSNRKDSSPTIIGDQSQQKFINIDSNDPTIMNTFYCKLSFTKRSRISQVPGWVELIAKRRTSRETSFSSKEA